MSEIENLKQLAQETAQIMAESEEMFAETMLDLTDQPWGVCRDTVLSGIYTLLKVSNLNSLALLKLMEIQDGTLERAANAE